jgi:DNA-binding MarR family transcriptional regulator
MNLRVSAPVRNARGKIISEAPPVDFAAASRSSPLDTLIGYQLRRAQLATFQEFIERFRSLKLRPAEFAVIMVLGAHPGLKQADAAAILAIKRANFVALMDRLEKRGLAERRGLSADRRSYALFLTDKGRLAAREAAPISERFENHLIARLGGKREALKLMALLGRVIG